MQEKRLKKGDTVKVIAGKEKGKTGKILSTIPDKQRVSCGIPTIGQRQRTAHSGGRHESAQ